MVRLLTSFFLLLVVSVLAAQHTDIPLNSSVYRLTERLDAKSGVNSFTTVKPLSRSYLKDKMQSSDFDTSLLDKYDSNYLNLELREESDSTLRSSKPIFGRFFEYPSDVFQVNIPDFSLHVNPIVVLGAGSEKNQEILFENYRGIEIRGEIDGKVGFYTLLTENQARYPSYVQGITDSTLAVPYEGFWKEYKDTGVDFLRAQAYVGINLTKHITSRFGYGKHFVGDGKRSLILSDFGNNYPYLRLNTQIWKIQYTNIFAQLIGDVQGGTFGLLGVGAFTKKYLAFHHLSIQVHPKLTIGLFESVIYGDSTQGVKASYFNPLIFYKALEQQDGSSDNVILGLDFKWNLFNATTWYGQLVIDELVVKEAFSNSGWWGNKQGFQLGAKYFDAFGISNFNLQAEWNQVRPYVYGHDNNFTSYSHYHQPLAHPIGANFREVLFSMNYKVIPRLTLFLDYMNASYGDDEGAINYGRDILKSYQPDSRPGDYGNDLLQGNETKVNNVQSRFVYELYHNMQLELYHIYRTSESELTSSNTNVAGFTYRWNFPYRSYLF
ncbi:MAG: hypothetical protein ACI83W_001514 [Marinoscillum sp.]|jgi:hypothetical protein